MTRIPICGSFGVLTPGVLGVGLTFGTFQNQFNVDLPVCTAANGVEFDRTTAQAIESYESIRLNDGELFRTTCSLQMPVRDANCNVVLSWQRTDIARINQTTNVTFNTINGPQTYTPLQPMPGNTLSQGAETRGHWFFCTTAT